MSTLVATDLDRTLVFSARWCAGIDPARLRAVEHRAGVATGWTTSRAADLLVELAGAATWVPVTTRTPDEYRRLTLPGPPGLVLCAHGGVLLVDGRPDEAWAARVATTTGAAAPVGEILALLGRLRADLPDDVVGSARDAAGLFVVAGLAAAPPAPWLAELDGSLAARGWVARRVDRKLYAFPRGLDKASAVAALAARTGATTVLAAGDSPLDHGMLTGADAAVVPRHGEPGPLPPTVAVTASSGVVAGEEIASWLLSRAAGVGGNRVARGV